MYGALTEAYTAQLIARANPMTKIIESMAASDTKDNEMSLDEKRMAMVDTITIKLNKAKTDGSDDAVVEFYRKMLSKYAG